MLSFEDWWYKYVYEDPIVLSGPDTDVKAAYIAGFNACRDKWGGLTYKETLEDEK